MPSVLHEYTQKLVVSYFILISALVILAQTLYRDYFKALINLALSEEYSYLLVSFFSVFATIYLSMKFVGFSYGIRISKFLASLIALTTSIVLYVISLRSTEYVVQLQGAGFALTFISLILFVYEPSTPSDVIPLLTPLLLIPLPTSIVDSLTPVLSRLIGRIAAALTGATYIESTFVVLGVETPMGFINFSVETACSGIVTLSSVLSVFPVISYMISASRSSAMRKLLVALISLFAGLSIGFLGNLIRVLLVVLVARYVNPQLALTVFHYSPSVVYSTVSTFLAYYIAVKYASLERVLPKPLLTDKPVPHISWEMFSGSLVVVILLVSSIHIFLATTLPSRNALNSFTIYVDNLERAINNPVALLGESSALIVHASKDEYLTRVIGALNVLRVRVLLDGEFYTGFVEVVDNPARLHTWQLCLTLQGYNVVSSWSKEVDSREISYILVEKEGRNYILAYTVFPVVVKTPGLESLMYLRVSLFRNFENLEEVVDRLTSAVLELTPLQLEETWNVDVYVYIVISYALVAILLAYFCLMTFGLVVSRFKNKFSMADQIVK